MHLLSKQNSHEMLLFVVAGGVLIGENVCYRPLILVEHLILFHEKKERAHLSHSRFLADISLPCDKNTTKYSILIFVERHT